MHSAPQPPKPLGHISESASPPAGGRAPMTNAGPAGSTNGQASSPQGQVVKEISICQYADGSVGVKSDGNEQKFGSLEEAMDAANTQLGGSEEAGEGQGDQASFDEGAAEARPPNSQASTLGAY